MSVSSRREVENGPKSGFLASHGPVRPPPTVPRRLRHPPATNKHNPSSSGHNSNFSLLAVTFHCYFSLGEETAKSEKFELRPELLGLCLLVAGGCRRRLGTVVGGRAGPWDAKKPLFGPFSTSLRDETDIEAFLGGRGALKRQYIPNAPRLPSKRGKMGSRRPISPGPD
jgi:hypothetical protein